MDELQAAQVMIQRAEEEMIEVQMNQDVEQWQQALQHLKLAVAKVDGLLDDNQVNDDGKKELLRMQTHLRHLAEVQQSL